MKDKQKPLIKLLLILYISSLSLIALSDEKKDEGVSTCNQRIMNSYLLKGREKSNNHPVLMCPSITANCCTRHDQQRAYHYVRNIVEARITEYNTKIDILMQRLLNIHKLLKTKPPTFKGNRFRKRFCSKNLREVLNFDLVGLYNTLHSEILLSVSYFENHYAKFFCMLCDGKAHQFISINQQSQYVNFEASYCKDMLVSNEELLENLNIKLVKYLVNLQHSVDCVHYSRSFNLKFPRMDKVKQSTRLLDCLENMHGERFVVKCASTCRRIRFSKLTPFFQGDFRFLNEMSTAVNRFFKYKESGSVISFRLRRFFRQFRINPRIARTRRTNFKKNLTKRPVKTKKGGKSRKLNDSKTKEVVKSHKDIGEGKSVKQSRAVERPKERKLFDGGNTENSNENTVFGSLGSKNYVHKYALMGLRDNNSQVPEVEPRLYNKRFLTSLLRAKRKTKRKKLSKVRYPLPYYDKQLDEFYNELNFPKNENIPTIYVIKEPPIDFDKMRQNWGLNTGINMANYEKNRFDMPSRIFYNQLYKYRRPEIPDTRITMFLMDFNKNFYKNAKEALNMDAEILVTNYGTFEGELELGQGLRRRRLEQSNDHHKKQKSNLN